MTLSRPRTTCRVLRGSALGVGLLVAGGYTAPAAFAIEDPTVDEVPADAAESVAPLEESPAPVTPADETPTMAPALSGDFGTGKDFAVQVQPYGPVPGDLDLSGAVFRATPVPVLDEGEQLDLVDDATSYTCTTDVDGRCTFDGPAEAFNPFLPPFTLPRLLTADRVDADVPAGTYTLTQVSSSPGLAAAIGSKDFTICDEDCGYPFGITGQVGNDSLFRTALVTTVTDAETDEPLACAGYELSGPDYPHDGTLAAAEPVDGTVPAECADPSASPTTAPTTTAAPTQTTSGAPTTTTGADPDQGTDPADQESTESSSTSSSSPASPTVVVLGLAAADDPLVDFGTQTSDSTGTMTFESWFLPGDGYLLTPTATPAGYAPDVTDSFGITTTALQAAAGEPAAVARALVTDLAAGASPTSGGTAAGAAPATTPAPAAAAGTTGMSTAAAADPAALAVTGTPVGTMLLVGGGLVALGGGALATGGVLRRRGRQTV